MLEGYDPVTQALQGTLFTWGVTALGSAIVFIATSEVPAHRQPHSEPAAHSPRARSGRSSMLRWDSRPELCWRLVAPRIAPAGALSAPPQASYWSLLAPAIEAAENQGYGDMAFVPAAAGFVLGALFVHAVRSAALQAWRGGGAHPR